MNPQTETMIIKEINVYNGRIILWRPISDTVKASKTHYYPFECVVHGTHMAVALQI